MEAGGGLGQEAVHVQLIDRDHVYPPINDGRHGEDCSPTQLVSCSVLLCIVEFSWPGSFRRRHAA